MDDAIGVHHFQKIRLLRTGTYAKVFLVQSRGLPVDGLFAMKVIEKTDLLRRHYERRAVIERTVLGMTCHPFITRLYYAFQTKRYLYLVMQYCSGGPIFTLKRRLLTENAVRMYIAELIVVLEYLHVLGIIHRDLTPANVLLHASGHLIVCDFSKATLSANSIKTHSRKICKRNKHTRYCCRWHNTVEPKAESGTFDLGPPNSSPSNSLRPGKHAINDMEGPFEFVAPEILANMSATPAVDWWALGILMFYMLFGVTPFQGINDEETKNNILQQDLILPITPMVSPACRDLLFRLLEKDVSLRLQSPPLIKSHPFFRSIKWSLLRHQQPPIIPKPQELAATTNSIPIDCFRDVPSGACQIHVHPPDAIDSFTNYAYTIPNNHQVFWDGQ